MESAVDSNIITFSGSQIFSYLIFISVKCFAYIRQNLPELVRLLNFLKNVIAVYIGSYVTMSSDLYGTCRHCFYGTRFGYCSKGTKSSSDNIVPIFIHPII